jgi:hypothetical protein
VRRDLNLTESTKWTYYLLSIQGSRCNVSARLELIDLLAGMLRWDGLAGYPFFGNRVSIVRLVEYSSSDGLFRRIRLYIN